MPRAVRESRLGPGGGGAQRLPLRVDAWAETAGGRGLGGHGRGARGVGSAGGAGGARGRGGVVLRRRFGFVQQRGRRPGADGVGRGLGGAHRVGAEGPGPGVYREGGTGAGFCCCHSYCRRRGRGPGSGARPFLQPSLARCHYNSARPPAASCLPWGNGTTPRRSVGGTRAFGLSPASRSLRRSRAGGRRGVGGNSGTGPTVPAAFWRRYPCRVMGVSASPTVPDLA